MTETNVVVSILGSFIAAASAVTAVAVTQYWAEKRERETRRHKSEVRRIQRRFDHQQKALVELQNAMGRAVSAMRVSSFESISANTENGANGTKLAAASNRVFVALTSFDCIRNRIEDAELRKLAGIAIAAIDATKTPDSIEDSKQTHVIMRKAIQALNE